MMMESSENSIMSEVTDHVPVLLKDIPPSSSPQTVDDPLKVMQNDLHSRGTDLSKAWTSLFSLLTKYQAELTVKENQIDIAERQLETRKQQLSMLNDQVVSPDDTSKLQEQLNQKELVLSRCQQELTNTSDMLNRVQSDLSSHMQQLERARHEQLQNHEKLLNYQSEITKLKSELMLKQEEIHIKDNLVQKLQNQLVRETSDLNAEISRLKENIESHVRVLDNERRSHEQTRKSVRSLQQNKSRIGGTVQQNVIEIPDSPPTLDLSVEQHDFGLSNIISLSEQQPMEQESHSAQFRHHPYRQETVRTPPMTLSSPTQRSPVNKLGNIHSDITDRWRSSASATAASQSVSSTASDTFFPLSTSAMDASIEQQNLNIKQEPALSGSVPISGPIPGGSSSQGHQSSNDSDTGQSQFMTESGFFPRERQHSYGGFRMLSSQGSGPESSRTTTCPLPPRTTSLYGLLPGVQTVSTNSIAGLIQGVQHFHSGGYSESNSTWRISCGKLADIELQKTGQSQGETKLGTVSAQVGTSSKRTIAEVASLPQKKACLEGAVSHASSRTGEIHVAMKETEIPIPAKVATEPVNEFLCELCHKGFQTRANLRMHKVMKHRVESTPRDYKCPYCGESVPPSGMKQHLARH
ncbi:uncharacterized protein LOC135488797 isoform X4 [Lineus longissimus]|uniref:uncharacterized protein LOC135488797 isoform X4 n=1 Tax=Lineus longissimus TaxID=88925 RepID=UPI00315CD854